MPDDEVDEIEVEYDGPRFAMVPEWLLDCHIHARAFQLYAVLLAKYVNRAKGSCYPSRKTIAADMRCSKSTVDRAMTELRGVGAVTITHRKNDRDEWMSSLYKLHFMPVSESLRVSSPVERVAAPVMRGSRTNDDQSRIIDPEENTSDLSPSAPDVSPERQKELDSARRLCEIFNDKRKSASPEWKPGNVVKGRIEAADLMLRKDQRDKREILETLDWCFTGAGAWWLPRIQSIDKFRAQYGRLREEMAQDAQKAQNGQSRPRGVQQQPPGAPVQFGTDGKVTEAYKAWEAENLRAIKADMIDEIGEAGIEEARAADRLPPWWDDV